MFLLKTGLIFLLANGYSLERQYAFPKIVWIILCICFLCLQARPSVCSGKLPTARLSVCKGGCELLRLFLCSAACSILYAITGFAGLLAAGSIIEEPRLWLVNTAIAVLIEAVVFWNGIVRIYMTSRQLGIRLRLIGIICGMIPVAHLFALAALIRTAEREAAFETEKCKLNKEREAQRICATRYPILMVHGVFFRDFRYFNYWGRIPKELEQNGAVIYYGNHQSAASVEDSAEELAARIRQIVSESGCGKVNLIAHSKGGLDCRYALAKCGIADMVASLTTVNTPHRGCEFADYLLSKIPERQKQAVAAGYNAALRKFGDTNPDFLAAVYDLTADACKKRNEQIKDVSGVFYQSVGSKLKKASGGRFPLNFSYHLVRFFDGGNDGLVGENSFPWGESYQMQTAEGRRGISHGDMIDLNRENFDGFDVREFYVQLVGKLKERGF
ncbi:MAG: triacylglycerol lipase [Lachnospiraceae bacterium]|nr:triacylglycerol lipase [Lachnospiraceae bacterium]